MADQPRHVPEEAAATGGSKAEPIWRAIGNELDRSTRTKHTKSLPTFRSDRGLSVTEQDELVGEQIEERAARR